MVHRAAACDASGNVNLILFHKIHIDLGKGILIFAYDNSGAVLPQYKNIVVGMQKQIFLNCKIQVRIGRFQN